MKYIDVLLAIVVAFSISACGESETTPAGFNESIHETIQERMTILDNECKQEGFAHQDECYTRYQIGETKEGQATLNAIINNASSFDKEWRDYMLRYGITATPYNDKAILVARSKYGGKKEHSELSINPAIR